MKWPQLPSRDSLQWRLTVGSAVLLTVLWIAAAVATGLVLREEIDEVFDSALQEVAQRVLPLAYIELLNRDEDATGSPTAQMVPTVDPHSEYITYIVRDAKGRPLLRSHDSVPDNFPTDLSPGFRDRSGQRFYTESGVSGTLFVTAAERLGHRRSAANKALLALVWPLAVLLPLSIAGVSALLSRSLSPVSAWQRQIEARGRGNLTPVGATGLPSEIATAAASVDRLIERLARALQAERSFTANSAHELRTPIAAALAQTQRMVVELAAGPILDRAAAVETSLRDLSRLSEKLLQLAKAEGGGGLSAEPHDLGIVLTYVLDELCSSGTAGDRIVVTLPPIGAVLSSIDCDAFAILARNLIENALKHGTTVEPVVVALTPEGVFSVVNGGPVLSPDDLERIGRPFERGATFAGGTGLGLAIVEAIAKAAGGHLELLSPAAGRADGFEARAYLPVHVAQNEQR